MAAPRCETNHIFQKTLPGSPGATHNGQLLLSIIAGVLGRRDNEGKHRWMVANRMSHRSSALAEIGSPAGQHCRASHEHLVVAVDDPAQRRAQVARGRARSRLTQSRPVMAFRQRADDRGMIWAAVPLTESRAWRDRRAGGVSRRPQERRPGRRAGHATRRGVGKPLHRRGLPSPLKFRRRPHLVLCKAERLCYTLPAREQMFAYSSVAQR